jgi:NSS family neurotransmitter:Na+ symporter
MAAFFLALFFAAMTSLISMVELATRVLVDKGMARRRAITWVAIAGFVLGVPSALSLAVFENQDNVWGVGLLISGLFFGLAVLRYGVDDFRERFVNSAGSDMRIGRVWNVAIWVVTAEALILLVWWLSQTISEQGLAASIDPFARWSLGTVLLQFAVVLVLCIAFNRRLARLAHPVERIGGEP